MIIIINVTTINIRVYAVFIEDSDMQIRLVGIYISHESDHLKRHIRHVDN